MAFKKPLEDYQAQISDLVADWATFLGIYPQWTIDIEYKKQKDMSDGVSATCTWATNYRGAVIKFNCDWLVKTQPNDREITQTVVHELGHIINAELWDTIQENLNGDFRSLFVSKEEASVDTWTNLIIRARGEYVEEDNDDGSLSEGYMATGAEQQNRLL